MWCCGVRRLADDSGERKSGARSGRRNKPKTKNTYGKFELQNESPSPASTGSAARFYPNCDFSHETTERLALGAVSKYASKPSQREKSSGLERFVWRKGKNDHRRIWSEAAIDEFWRWQEERKGLPGEGFDDWLIATGGEKRKIHRIPYTWGNIHTTVKSLSLLIWLSRLLLPPDIYAPRRILVPFCGSGSECAAALMAGFEEVVGIEQGEEYCQIAEARLQFWRGWSQRAGSTEVPVILKAHRKAQKAEAKREAEEAQIQMELGEC